MPHVALQQTAHRPWPIPSTRWTWRQSWLDLLFAHWRVPVESMRRFVPEPLEIEQFDGSAWVALVPFRMAGVMRRPWPDMPGISAFSELNVRTYVTFNGRPGVWFLSLDAANRLAVWAARRFFHLPYHFADMSVVDRMGQVTYRSVRSQAEFTATYRATSAPYSVKPGTLEHHLTERYCLYAQAPDKTIWRSDVHHHPWPLQSAKVDIERNTVLASHGLALDEPPALLHFSKRIDVMMWPAERVV